MRIKAIDTFRGLSIVLMVFFTIILTLSNNLPWFLVHNLPGTLRPGDFVLPMFIFASGMSLVFFHEKRKKLPRTQYFLDVVERFGKLAIIWLFLSPLSAGKFLGMDEVMLYALLFIPSIVLVRYSENEIAIAALMVFALYFGLQSLNALPDFSLDYLGGYGAAIFYLPVMLAGLMAGKSINETGKLILPSLVVALFLVLVTPPYKLSVTPSFMALSVFVSLIIFELCKKIDFEPLDYLGRKPIRYWVLMFLALGIPIAFYAISQKTTLPLNLDWSMAVLVSLAGTVILYAISKLLDLIIKFIKEIEIVKG